MYGQFLELTLHCSLPLVSTSVFLRKMITHFDGGIGVGGGDWMALACPHLFTLWYAFGIAFLGGTVLSFADDDVVEEDLIIADGLIHVEDEDDEDNDDDNNDENDNNNNDNMNEDEDTLQNRRSISAIAGRTLTYVFLLLPTLMHLLIFRRRLFVRYAAIDGAHIADLLLVPSLTLLLHFAMVYGGYAWWVARLYPPLRLSPPQNRTRRPRRNSGRRRRWWAPIDRSILPELAYAITLLSFQYRYLIPFVTSHQHHPTVDTAADDATSSRQRWKIAFFINLGLLLLTLAPLFRRAGDDRGGGHGGGRPVSIAERMWAWVEEYRRDVVRGTYREDVYRDDDGSGDGRGEREDGRRLCVGMNDGKIFLLDASLVPAASYLTAHPMDGSRVAIVRADGTVRVWNADRHSLLIFLAHETYG